MPRKLQTGFTLVELIIVVAIISILASIPIPAYNDYVKVSKRSDAQASLMALAIAQEKYRASNPTYGVLVGGTNNLSGYGITFLSESGYYNLESEPVLGKEGKEFTAKATANFLEDGDSDECETISINQEGPVGTTCWGR